MQFAASLARVVAALQPGHTKSRDQLERAAVSIHANIAEAAGSFSRGQKRRYFEIAKASADECAGVLDYLVARHAVDAEIVAEPKELLLEIVKMLAALIRNIDRAASFEGLG